MTWDTTLTDLKRLTERLEDVRDKLDADPELVRRMSPEHRQALRDDLREVRASLKATGLLDEGDGTQRCRDCGRAFPYDPEADICPECVAAMHPDREDEDDG